MSKGVPLVLHVAAAKLYNNRMTNAGEKQGRPPATLARKAVRQRAFFQRMDAKALSDLLSQLADVSFFLKDRQGRFIALNRRGCDYCGVANEADAIGCTDRDFFPRNRADDFMRDDEAVMNSGQAILQRIENAPEGLGSARLVMTSKIPVRDAKGHVIGVAGISRAVEQLSPHRQHLSRLEQVVSEMVDDPGATHSTTTLAATAGLSASQFERTFRQAFGTTPRQHLLRLRIENACRLLSNSDDTVASIALACGFFDHAHFTRTFQRIMAMTPKQYRLAAVGAGS